MASDDQEWVGGLELVAPVGEGVVRHEEGEAFVRHGTEPARRAAKTLYIIIRNLPGNLLESFLVLLVNDSEYSRSAGAKPILPLSCIYLVSLARCCAPASRAGGRGNGPGKLIPRL